MSFLGPVHAYMAGRIYGVWMLTKSERKGGTVILRFTNDIGSDSQTVELKPLPNGTYQYTALEGNNVRRVQGRKLVKVPDTMIMNDRRSEHTTVLPHLFNLKPRHAECVLPKLYPIAHD